MMDLIVSWLCSAIALGFQKAMEFFSNTFGYDIAEFNAVFPFASEAYGLIRKIALALALVLAAWQVVQFFWRGAEKAADTPPRAALNAVVAVGFIYYGNYIFDLILKFCKYPYDALLSIDSVEGGWNIQGGWGLVTEFISDAFAGSSMILYLIMLILIAFSMVKLLLEIVERYVVAFILVYLSPLAAATLASSPTSGIYKKYFTMFISQCILIFLNAWCMQMACSGLDMGNYEGEIQNTLIVQFLMCYGFLRISAKMDSYLNQLGLNAAITGSGLGAEIFGAGMALTGMGGGAAGAAGSAVGGKVLGAAKTVQQWTNRVNPFAAAGRAVQDGLYGGARGFSEAYRSGGVKGFAEQAKKAYAETRNDGGSKLKSAVSGAGAVAGNFGKGAATGVAQSDNLLSNSGRKLSDYASQEIDKSFENATGEKPIHPITEKLTSADLTQEQNNANVKAWSNSQRLSQEAFEHVQKAGLTVDDAERVAAITKGLGVEATSAEANNFVQVGFGQDGVKESSFTLDKTGIHAQYDKDGYRHKMDVYDQAQYDKLSTQEREAKNLQRHFATDGKRYYVGTTKTKLEKDGQ